MIMAKRAKDQIPNTNPDDEANCFESYSEKMGDIARLRQSIAAMLTRYDRMGVDVDGVKFAYKMAQKDDAADVHQRRTAALMRLGIIEWNENGQSSFLKGLDMPSQEAQERLQHGRVKAAGYNDGYAGGLRDNCPHDPGTIEHALWSEQWLRGSEDRIAARPDLADVVKAEPRKRGRPRKEKTEELTMQ